MDESIVFMTPRVDKSRVYFSSYHRRGSDTDSRRAWYIDYGEHDLGGITSETLLFVQMMWELRELIRDDLSSPIRLSTESLLSNDSWTFIHRLLQGNGLNPNVLKFVGSGDANPVFRIGNSSVWNVDSTYFAPIQKEQRRIYADGLFDRLGVRGEYLQFGAVRVAPDEVVPPTVPQDGRRSEVAITTNFWLHDKEMERLVQNDFVYSTIGFLPVILARGYSDVICFHPLFDSSTFVYAGDRIAFVTQLSKNYSSLQNFLNYACRIPIRITNAGSVATDLGGHLCSSEINSSDMENYRGLVVAGDLSDRSRLMFVLNDLSLGRVYEGYDYGLHLGQSRAFQDMTSLVADLLQRDHTIESDGWQDISLADLLIYLSSLNEIVCRSLLGKTLLGIQVSKIRGNADRLYRGIATLGLGVRNSQPSNGLDLQFRLLVGEFLKMSMPPKKFDLLDGLIDARVRYDMASFWPLGYADIPA